MFLVLVFSSEFLLKTSSPRLFFFCVHLYVLQLREEAGWYQIVFPKPLIKKCRQLLFHISEVTVAGNSRHPWASFSSRFLYCLPVLAHDVTSVLTPVTTDWWDQMLDPCFSEKFFQNITRASALFKRKPTRKWYEPTHFLSLVQTRRLWNLTIWTYIFNACSCVTIF